MEKFGIVASADRWIDVVGLRNALVHDYSALPTMQIDLANKAWFAVEELIATSAAAADYVRREALL